MRPREPPGFCYGGSSPNPPRPLRATHLRTMNDKDRYWDCLDLAMEASHGGRTDEALAWLDEALKARPGGAEAHNGRGEILWDEGRAEEALAQFERAVGADPKFLTAHLNRAELLIEEMGEFERAIEQCDHLLSGSGETPRPDRGTEAEVYYLKSKALFYLEDLEGAQFLVRRAIKTSPDVAVYRAFEGQISFELGRFEEARKRLEHAVLLDPDSGHAVYHLGLALERLDEAEEATRAFRQANAFEPDHYPMPIPIDDAEFEAAAKEAIDELPASIREYVDPVPVIIQDFPDAELLDGERVSPQILGIFIGVPRTEAQPSQQALDMDRVYLFKKNLEKICRDARRPDRADPGDGASHEIGHHIGFERGRPRAARAGLAAARSLLAEERSNAAGPRSRVTSAGSRCDSRLRERDPSRSRSRFSPRVISPAATLDLDPAESPAWEPPTTPCDELR